MLQVKVLVDPVLPPSWNSCELNIKKEMIELVDETLKAACRFAMSSTGNAVRDSSKVVAVQAAWQPSWAEVEVPDSLPGGRNQAEQDDLLWSDVVYFKVRTPVV